MITGKKTGKKCYLSTTGLIIYVLKQKQLLIRLLSIIIRMLYLSLKWRVHLIQVLNLLEIETVEYKGYQL